MTHHQDEVTDSPAQAAGIDIATMREAREHFARLLASHHTTEQEWQRFFTAFPFALSLSLPVSLSHNDIIPRGRPGRSEADFIFFRRSDYVPTYGVIEIKRPDTTILNIPRRNLVRLSRDADTALGQAQQYAKDLEREMLLHPSRMVAIGNRAYIFLIVFIR
jgi:hypothetical protein